MSRNQIKGLTVEIGGDTTGLGKALESVNKQSGELSAELGEINKLLKFDPSNSDLLAQKQKVLANIIENTADKLKTLKEAERQVQKQFERGEVSEAQVRALQRELASTESKLKHYSAEAQKAANATDNLGNEASETGGSFEKMGGKLGTVAKVGIGAVVAGATAAVGALVASAEASREYRTEMGKLTTAFEVAEHRTEIATEAYKRLYSVIGETDQSVEAAQQIALLAESEEDVVQWADLGAGVIARFGDALQPETFFEAANETIKLGEATGAYVQLLEGAGYSVDEFNAGLAECVTAEEKQAYMLKITEELLGGAADKYRETNAEVIRANEANEAWSATMAEVGGVVEPILTDVKMLGAALLGDLVPGITSVMEAFRGLVNGEEGSAEAVGNALSGLLTQVVEKAVALLPTLVSTAISLVSSLATSLVEMLPGVLDVIVVTLLNGIPVLVDGALQLLMAILQAVPLLLPILAEAIPQIVLTVITSLLTAIPDLLNGAVQFLLAIVSAIPILIKTLLPAIPVIVDTLVTGLLDCMPVLVDGAVQLLFGILEAIPEIAAALYEEAPSIVTSIADALIGAIPQLLRVGVQLLDGLIQGMVNYDYVGKLKKVGNGIVSGFKKVFDIHSPSRVMMGIGEMLDEGLAEGINDNARAPINAIDKLSEDMIDGAAGFNGLSVEREMARTHNPGMVSSPADGISNKLDKIYQAILNGQVIMLDGKTLVGSTAARYDNELGQRRVLTERGAL